MGSPAAIRKTRKHQERTSARAAEAGPLIRKMPRITINGPRAPRILWIPGLGGDRVMFAPLISRLDQLVYPAPLHSFLEYPDVMPGEVDSLESLAALLAQGILPEEPYDLAIGCSMGGMMVQILRMKGWLDTRKCVLLSTGMSGQDLIPVVRMAAAIPPLPGFLRRPAQTIIAGLYPLFRLGVPTAADLGRMFSRFPRTIFFEAPRWIRDWKGVPAPFYEDSIVVHGTHDPLMSYSRVAARKMPDLRIEGGSHILFATHADEVAAYLAPYLSVPPGEASRKKSTRPGPQGKIQRSGQTKQRSQRSGAKKKLRAAR